MGKHRLQLGFIFTALILLSSTIGCRRHAAASPGNSVVITLDWKPEPEFGGFYQAQLSGAFKNSGLEAQITTAGAGAPTWQLVASGQSDFATTAADQILIARASGADVVAVFAVYQTCPQGIMVHRARGFKSFQDVFTHAGVLAAEDDTWLKYMLAKFKPVKVTITGYTGGVAAFLAKPDYSQQCFVTSEPLLAQRAGSDPQTFLIADAGYNPYTTVLITRGDLLRNNPAKVKSVVDACRQGWQEYLDDPSPANAMMEKLNTEMAPADFEQAAKVQKPLIQTDTSHGPTLGDMSAPRWDQLGRQLVELKVIDKAPPADQCFANIDGATASYWKQF